jgi:hypothetical protein
MFKISLSPIANVGVDDRSTPFPFAKGGVIRVWVFICDGRRPRVAVARGGLEGLIPEEVL